MPSGELPEPERFLRLLPERKHFLDTNKMIAYRAETALVSVLREWLACEDDARALLRHILRNGADLVPDFLAKTLTVRLHHLAQNAHDFARATSAFTSIPPRPFPQGPICASSTKPAQCDFRRDQDV